MLPISTIMAIITGLETALPLIEGLATNALPIIDQAAKALETAIPGSHLAEFQAKVDELVATFGKVQPALGNLAPLDGAIKALEAALGKHSAAA